MILTELGRMEWIVLVGLATFELATLDLQIGCLWLSRLNHLSLVSMEMR
jgi:hypothetical protein